MNKEEAKVRIDSIINHLEWRHGGGTDYVESDHDQAHQIIDQIELDHPKVKLPWEVGEWVDACCNDGNAQSLLNYEVTPDAVDEWADGYENDGINDHFGKLLMQAYLYGWEAEPEAKWYVKAPKEWVGEGISHFTNMCKDRTDTGMDRTNAYKNNPYAQFTRAELKKYHLDSDIFTLVPVENEEVSR